MNRQTALQLDLRIPVYPSPTADTRTCDVSTVTRDQLLQSSEQHIEDVRRALKAMRIYLSAAAAAHDDDKITGIDWFHADFRTKFTETGWWDNHRQIWRHHLAQSDGVPDDVNLLDVLEYVADCVMAGTARSGTVTELAMTPELLQRAFANTVAWLCANVERMEPR